MVCRLTSHFVFVRLSCILGQRFHGVQVDDIRSNWQCVLERWPCAGELFCCCACMNVLLLGSFSSIYSDLAWYSAHCTLYALKIAGGLRIRDQPNPSGSIVGMLEQGKRVEQLGVLRVVCQMLFCLCLRCLDKQRQE